MESSAFRKQRRSLDNTVVLQGGWFVLGAVVAFLLPFIFSSTLDLNHDLYYGLYFTGTGAFLAAYARLTNLDIRALFSRNWRWSLGIGLLAAAFVVFNVLSREDSTDRPEGLYFVFTIGWRGVLYGIVDGLLLTAFPAAVAFALMNDRVETILQHVVYGLIGLGLVLVITATYHLGYEQFREDGVGQPETGNTIISIPALITTNPLGSVIAHASMHVAADVHAYETEVFLPPEVEAD